MRVSSLDSEVFIDKQPEVNFLILSAPTRQGTKLSV